MSVGRWGSIFSSSSSSSSSSSAEFQGVWYNRESFAYHDEGKYQNIERTKTLISKSELNNISSYTIENTKGYHLLWNNCTDYAVRAWNSVASNQEIPLESIYTHLLTTPFPVALPEALEIHIKLFFEYYTNTFMFIAENGGYYDGYSHWINGT
jgi:hypothetical protein